MDSGFEDDVQYIDFLIQKDDELKAVMLKIETSEVSEMVSRVFKCLKEESEAAEVEFDAKAKLVLFCFRNWLELSICKKLLQIMKPEVLVTHNFILPPHYKIVYLKNQFHFSLPALLSHDHNSLQR